MVTPGSQCVCDSLAGDTLRTLQHVAVVTAELHAGAHSARRHKRDRHVSRDNTRGGYLTADTTLIHNHGESSMSPSTITNYEMCRSSVQNCISHERHFFSLFFTTPCSNRFCFLIWSKVPLTNTGEAAELQSRSLCAILSVKLNVSSCWHAAVCHLVGLLRHQLWLVWWLHAVVKNGNIVQVAKPLSLLQRDIGFTGSASVLLATLKTLWIPPLAVKYKYSE